MVRADLTGIATTVHTYRMAARAVRSRTRRPNPLARGAADYIYLRDRAMTVLDACAPQTLTDALREEHVLMAHLSALHSVGADDTGARLALDAARRRLRRALADFTWRRLAAFHLDVLVSLALHQLAATSRAAAPATVHAVARADVLTGLADLQIARHAAAGVDVALLDRNGRITP